MNKINYDKAYHIGLALQVPKSKMCLFFGRSVCKAQDQNGTLVFKELFFSALPAFALYSALYLPISGLSRMGKIIYWFSHTRLDSKLSLAPVSVKLPELDDDEDIDYKDLANQPHLTTSQKEYFDKLFTEMESEDKELVDLLTFRLKLIINYFNKETLSDIKKSVYLTQLADAAAVCFPTSLEVSLRICNELYGDSSIDEQNLDPSVQKILTFVQKYKEETILHIGQTKMNSPQWHGLNFMRHYAGVKFGLNVEASASDPYGNLTTLKQPIKFIVKQTLSKVSYQLMYELCRVKPMIKYVQNQINQELDEKFTSIYAEALSASIEKIEGCTRQEAGEKASDYFDEETFRISEQGTYLLLKGLNIVT